MSRYTIDDNSNPKHSVTKSMVGPLPLAPHHDYLQYMYHVYVMQTGSKPGCYTNIKVKVGGILDVTSQVTSQD